MKIFSTPANYSDHFANNKHSEKRSMMPNFGSQFSSLEKIYEMMDKMDLSSPSDTSVSIIMEYARQKHSQK